VSSFSPCHSRAKRWRPLPTFALLIALLCAAGTVWGQEAIRASIAGQDAAEARKRAAAGGYYNIKLSEMRLRFQSALQFELNDNVNLSENDPQEDLVIRPRLNTHVRWPVTERNTLNFSLGAGYAKYLQETRLDRFFITPGSELSFDIYAGDFLINLHNRISITEEATQQATVSGTGNYGRIENTAGIEAIWDMNKAILSAGYDHVNFISTTEAFRHQDHVSELFHVRAGLRVNPFTLTGLEVGAGFTEYDRSFLNNSTHFSVGPFASTQISEYLSGRMSVGYTAYYPEFTGQIQDASEVNAFYADLTVNHRVSSLMGYSVSAGRAIQLGLFSNTLDMYYARLNMRWNVLRKFSLSTPLFYEHATESRVNGETLQRYGAAVTVGRRITRKLSGSVGYRFFMNESDRPGRDYVQNRLVFDFAYSF
jgi:hypothetical protein